MSGWLADQVFAVFTEIAEYGLERRMRRFYGDYPGKVTNAEDPQGQGRVRVSCQVVHGHDGELGLWAYPVTPYAGPDRGFFFPPEEDDPVWVSFDHGKSDQPRVSGSWWRNFGSARKPETAETPKEFAYVDGKPQRRGIKTKKGILLFDDAAPLMKMATINQSGSGTEAEVKHSVLLDSTEGEEQIVVASYGGHQSSWIDIAGEQALEHKSAKGHLMRIDDITDTLTFKTADGHTIEINGTAKTITINTLGQQKIVLSDTGASILLQDVTGNIIQTSPAGVNVTSPLNVNVTAAAAANVTAGAAATVTAAGVASLIGTGLVLQSVGGGLTSQLATGIANGIFTGLKSESYLGGLTLLVVGLLSLTGTNVQIVSPQIGLGNVGQKYALVDQRFITDFYLNHTHQVVAVGSPTGAPSSSPPLNAVTTQAVTAN